MDRVIEDLIRTESAIAELFDCDGCGSRLSGWKRLNPITPSRGACSGNEEEDHETLSTATGARVAGPQEEPIL